MATMLYYCIVFMIVLFVCFRMTTAFTVVVANVSTVCVLISVVAG